MQPASWDVLLVAIPFTEKADMTYVRTALIAATVALFACGGAAAAPGPNATAAATIATAAASAAATGTATSVTKASANNATAALARSEEHTSELQSPYDLVCRPPPEKRQPRDAHQPGQQ